MGAAGGAVVACVVGGSPDPPSTRPNTRENRRPTSSMMVKNAGTKSSDSRVETRSSPIIAIAIGDRNSPPAPNAKALGAMPATIAIVVIVMGRARFRPASMIAVVRSAPPCIASTAKSTSMIAFLVTISISMRMPMTTGVVIGRLVMNNARIAPAIDNGSENRMVIGCSRLREQHRQHHVDHHQAAAHGPAEAFEQLCLQLRVAALADRDAGRQVLHYRKALDGFPRITERGAADQVRLDAGLPLTVEADDVGGALAETYVGKSDKRDAPSALRRNADLLEDLPVGARIFLEEDADGDGSIAGIKFGERRADIADGRDPDRFRKTLGRDAETNSRIPAWINPQLRTIERCPGSTFATIFSLCI